MPTTVAETLFVLAAVVMPAAAVLGALTIALVLAVRRLAGSRAETTKPSLRELELSESRAVRPLPP